MLTVQKLRTVLSYNPETGEFRWRIPGGQKRVGDIAGRINNQGYRQIQIDGKLYQASRLAWFYIHGRWPAPMADHINRCRNDDRLSNLREATASQNSQNHKPVRGITKHKSGRWQAQISHNGKKIYLGLFDAEASALSAYDAARLTLHGAIR